MRCTWCYGREKGGNLLILDEEEGGYPALLKGLEASLRDRGRARALYGAMRRGLEGRNKSVQEFEDFQAFRLGVRAIKEKSVERLEELVAKFKREAERRGAKVFIAKDGKEALHYILELLKRWEAELVAKAKSLTSEEIELNEPLERSGYRVVETDLGERIIQLARERPFHLVFPAIHKSLGEIAQLLSLEEGEIVRPQLEDIMRVVRRRLREVFLQADVGITGANVAIAETGSLVIETNEGNARLVSSLPRLHIALVGLEKVVPTLADALQLVRAHAVSATGQRTTTYVSILSGRCPLAGDARRELHIILLDNGRRAMKGDPWLREALYCIRCGACMNACAPYSIAGGHVFGHIYPGPIGIPWTYGIHGLENAKFAHLCISCGLCKEVCPANIDLPLLIAKVKEIDVSRNGQLLVNRLLELYEELAEWGHRIAPVWNWLLRRKAVRILLELLIGIERSRPLPELRRHTFWELYERRRSKGRIKGKGEASEAVVLFLDFFPNYVEPELAMELVRLLEMAGLEVLVPRQRSSGYPFVAYGDLELAKRVGSFNIGQLKPYAELGYHILSLEPTATYALKHTYPSLLGSREAQLVASRTREALEYLWHLLKEGRLGLKAGLRGRVALHLPCHQRALSSGRYAIEMMRATGLEVEVRENGMCCGMAGTFGLKKGVLGHRLSVAMREPLLELFRGEEYDYIVTESSVCKLQLEQGLRREVLHPLLLLRGAFIGKR